MRSLVQNFLVSKTNPIGIDFGSDCLRVVQLRRENGQLHLVAAGQCDLPREGRRNWAGRAEHFIQGVQEILSAGDFQGRQVILGLPAAHTFLGHLRLPKTDAETLAKSLPWEIRGKLPIEPNEAVIKHIVAGEVFVEQEARLETIVMASRKDVVQGLLAAAQKARLDVVGMNVEIGAIVECFSQVYRRKGDDEAINCFLDLGWAGSRVIISCGRQILFVRGIGVGCMNINAAIAKELDISAEEAAARRRMFAEKVVDEPALAAAGPIRSEGTALADDRRRDLREIDTAGPGVEVIALATSSTVQKMVEELTLCQRYYEAAFPGKGIDRLIFIGGGAADRRLCQDIARGIGLPAQVGDPLARVEGREKIDEGSKRPQPGWAVAMGLSIGGMT